MIIALHVLLALSGILYTSYLLFAPAKGKFLVSYALLAATIGSGTYLVFSTKTHLVQACMMGLLYTGFIALGLTAAHRRLAAEQSTTKR